MWRFLNRLAYGAYCRFHCGREIRSARRTWRGIAAGEPEVSGGRVLCIATGRIGDLVLQGQAITSLRAVYYGHEIVVVGRPEVRVIVEPLVDQFVEISDRAALEQLTRERFRAAFGDLHVFYELPRLTPWLERIVADQRLLYRGYYEGPSLAPVRPWPRGWDLVPQVDRSRLVGDDLERRHLLHDSDHYFREVARRTGGNEGGFANLLTTLPLASDEAVGMGERLGVEGEFVTWQPITNNSKKDYPLERWREVLAAFPETTFVALGTKSEAERLASCAAPNLRVLAGSTTLAEGIALIAGARAHLGPDSGLTHIAAALGRPTVCVTQSANLGYFFPYPDVAGVTNLITVANDRFVSCSGCFSTCCHEWIGRTRSAGALCIRELSTAGVIEALRSALAVDSRSSQATLATR